MRIAWAGLLGFLLACGTAPPEPPASRLATPALPFADSAPAAWGALSPARYSTHGIDVSKYQGTIDWPVVRAGGIGFAYIKATEGGDRLDPRFAANWRGAAAAGVPRGAYHFFYFCRPAAEQAAWFIRHVPAERAALPPALDMEWNPHSPTCRRRPPPDEVRAEMRVFLDALARHYRKRPVVYVTPDFYRDNDLGRVAGVDFWLRAVADHPSAVYPGQNWAFWQYTGTGHVGGIAGPVDLNAFAGSPAEWRRWRAASMN